MRPVSARSQRRVPTTRPLQMPFMDSARTTTDQAASGKRVVKLGFTKNTETKKWRPNGNDCWFAKVGTPTPSVYSARSTSESARLRTAGSARDSTRSSARSSRRSGRSHGTGRSAAGSLAGDVTWEMTAAELWDQKLRLERQLEAVREEQDALMCEQLARVNNIIVDNPNKPAH